VIRRALAAVVVLASVAGCGVSTEDRPRPLDNSTRPRTTIPSVSTHPAPTTTTSPTTSPVPGTSRAPDERSQLPSPGG
jgi:hypothetical protein